MDGPGRPLAADYAGGAYEGDQGGLRVSRGAGGPSIGATVSSGPDGGALGQGGPLPGGESNFPSHQRGHLPGARSSLGGPGGPGHFPGAVGAVRGATGAVVRPHGGRTLSSSSSPPGRGGQGGFPPVRTPGGGAAAGQLGGRAGDAPDLPHGPAQDPPWGRASGSASPAMGERKSAGQARSSTIHHLLTRFNMHLAPT